MPNLKYPALFHLHPGVAFDTDHAADAPAPHDGIYRCACGHEAPAAEGSRLPGGPHPLHPSGQPIVWRLVAAARHNAEGAGPPEPVSFIAPSGWPPAQG